MSNDAMTNRTDENVRGIMVIDMTEITKLRYNAEQKRKDDIVAETKFGFVVKTNNVMFVHINHDNKCYRGQMMPWHGLTDFQTFTLDRVYTLTRAILTRPEKPSC